MWLRRPDDELEIEGDLTIHGVTRKVRFAVEGPTTEGKDPWGNIRIGASAITKINRKDYGLVWNAALETGGFLVGEDVAISIDAEFIKSSLTPCCKYWLTHPALCHGQRFQQFCPRNFCISQAQWRILIG